MEKSVSAAEKKLKVRNNLHIHDDLAFSILSKLPLKPLKRFGCVCKLWSLLFENAHFIKMLRTNFLSNSHSGSDHSGGDTFLLLDEDVPRHHAVLYLLPNERFENRIKLDLPPPFQEDANPYILSSVNINGIFCIGQDKHNGMVNTFRAVLWNPATTEFMVIPPSPDESVPPYQDPFFKFHGFGYDRDRDDYKVIRYMSFFHLTDEEEDVPDEDRSYDPILEIYSLKSNSWRILDVNIADFNYDRPWLGTGVYIDGVCHWWGNNDLYNSTGCLVSFDCCNEVLSTTPMLLDIDERCDFEIIERRLVVLNNSIALISNCLNINATTFHISTLGELGVMESWIKLFVVGPIPSIECPIGVGKKGDICFKRENDELVWIDLSSQIIDEIGVKGDKYARMGIYKESLLSIGGINN